MLTVCGKGSSEVSWEDGSELATKRLSDKERALAIKRLMVASAIQYTVYGVPSLYYGDEAGLEGYRDPFCRMPFPWGREEPLLIKHYSMLGKIRSELGSLFARGEFKVVSAEGGVIAYARYDENDTVCVIANASKSKVEYELEGEWYDMLNEKEYNSELAPVSCVILKKRT